MFWTGAGIVLYHSINLCEVKVKIKLMVSNFYWLLMLMTFPKIFSHASKEKRKEKIITVIVQVTLMEISRILFIFTMNCDLNEMNCMKTFSRVWSEAACILTLWWVVVNFEWGIQYKHITTMKIWAQVCQRAAEDLKRRYLGPKWNMQEVKTGRFPLIYTSKSAWV